MKRVIRTCLLLWLGCCALQAAAQRIEVQNTYSYILDKDLKGARRSIDKAAYHPQSCNLLKTWRLRTQVYEMLLRSDTTNQEALADSVLVSMQRWFALETDKYERLYVAGNLFRLANNSFRKAVWYFNQQPRLFDSAFYAFERAAAIARPLEPVMKTHSYYDSLMVLAAVDMAFCSYQMKRPTQETEALLQPVANHPISAIEHRFVLQALLARDRGDTTAWLQYLLDGQAQHPASIALANEEVIFHLQRGVPASFLPKLENWIAQNPEVADFYFMLGICANQYLQQPAVNNNDSLYNQWTHKANIAYQAALQHAPGNPVYTYNYGVLIFNHSVHYNERMNQLGQQMMKNPRQWDELETERHSLEKLRNASLRLASVQLEKSVTLTRQQLQPDDQMLCGALRALDHIYMLVKDYEKEQQTRQMLAAFDKCTDTTP
jgi:hypothetical protein